MNKSFLKWAGGKTRIIDNIQRNGYDDQTEVLTANSWKFFKDISNKDYFITRSLSGNLEYQRPTKINCIRYDKSLIRIKSRSTDLLVTPEHNVYVFTHTDFCAKRSPTFVKVKDLKYNVYYIPCGGIYFSSQDFLVPETMYLIGLYLSEGYFQKEKNKISDNMIICQNPGYKNDKMKRKIASFNPAQRDYRRIRAKVGYDLQRFILDNCGSGALNKFISPIILSNKHLDCLYEGMMDGDGSRSCCGKYRGKLYYCDNYYTSSKKLADGFQELCLKLGYDTRCRSRKRLPTILRGREIVGQVCYEIRVRKSKNKKIFTKKHIKEQQYNGIIYCVSVPNKTLFIKRCGTTSWCADSSS